jgi:hypothetical protein
MIDPYVSTSCSSISRTQVLRWIGLDEAVPVLACPKVDRLLCASTVEGFLAGLSPDGAIDPVTAAVAAIDALPHMQRRHRMAGISEDITLDTAMDVARWIRECHRRTGSWGLQEGNWLRFHLSGRLLHIGRLQFLPTRYQGVTHQEHDVIRVGDSVLEVHIPAGSPLDPDSCAHSFVESANIFSHLTWSGWICRSWLLAPRLRSILNQGSNIIAFQNMFPRIIEHLDDRQTIERVFDMWPLDLATAQRRTSLQRAILAIYSAGQRVDGATGFRPRTI